MASIYGPSRKNVVVAKENFNNKNNAYTLEKSGHIEDATQLKTFYNLDNKIMFAWRSVFGPSFDAFVPITNCTTFVKIIDGENVFQRVGKREIIFSDDFQHFQMLNISITTLFLPDDYGKFWLNDDEPKYIECSICLKINQPNYNIKLFAQFVFIGSIDTGICYDMKIITFPIN